MCITNLSFKVLSPADFNILLRPPIRSAKIDVIYNFNKPARIAIDMQILLFMKHFYFNLHIQCSRSSCHHYWWRHRNWRFNIPKVPLRSYKLTIKEKFRDIFIIQLINWKPKTKSNYSDLVCHYVTSRHLAP